VEIRTFLKRHLLWFFILISVILGMVLGKIYAIITLGDDGRATITTSQERNPNCNAEEIYG
jgi:hypothetical protein